MLRALLVELLVASTLGSVGASPSRRLAQRLLAASLAFLWRAAATSLAFANSSSMRLCRQPSLNSAEMVGRTLRHSEGDMHAIRESCLSSPGRPPVCQ